jgi:hypothetical protein
VSKTLEIGDNRNLATINLPSLTYVQSLLINYNAALATIILPSLSTVAGALKITYNSALSYASLPKLTFIAGQIFFCSNNVAFVIPAGPPDAPTGGLTSADSKGTAICYLQQGAGACSYVTCP